MGQEPLDVRRPGFSRRRPAHRRAVRGRASALAHASLAFPLILVGLTAAPALFSPAGALSSDLHSVALTTTSPTSFDLPSRALYGWGSNDSGQVGNGASGQTTPLAQSSPVAVATPAGVTFSQVAAGGGHSLGLSTTGQVYSWGLGSSGQLGVGTLASLPTPTPVNVPGGPVRAVAAGSSFSLALTTAGSITSWGSNFFGQLGTGTAKGSSLPETVASPSGTTFTSIAAGSDFAVALSSTGQIYTWGANQSGQLGDGQRTPRTAPAPIADPAGVTFTQVAAGAAHVVALSSAGVVYTWGLNSSGQLGVGSSANTTTMTEAALPPGSTITAIAAGGVHSVALSATGQVFDWGSDLTGQLATSLVNGATVDNPLPHSPLGLPAGAVVAAIGANWDATYAVTSDGTVWSWGGNQLGQLGQRSTGVNAFVPATLVGLPAGTRSAGVFAGSTASSAYLVSRSTQNLSFPATGDVTYGTPPLDLTPVTSSGGSSTGVESGPCRGALDHLYVTGTGQCQVVATQAGNFWFYPASSAVSFAVAPAPLTVSPDNLRITAGENVPAFSVTARGWVDNDPPSDLEGTPACSTPASSSSPPGTYPITCTTGTLAAPNYSITLNPEAVLTVVAPVPSAGPSTPPGTTSGSIGAASLLCLVDILSHCGTSPLSEVTGSYLPGLLATVSHFVTSTGGTLAPTGRFEPVVAAGSPPMATGASPRERPSGATALPGVSGFAVTPFSSRLFPFVALFAAAWFFLVVGRFTFGGARLYSRRPLATTSPKDVD